MSSVPAPRVLCLTVREGRVERIDPATAATLVRAAPETLEVSSAVPLVWIDLLNPAEAEEEFLRRQLLLHPLAVEDAMRGRQRPKLDRYSGYFFIVCYSTRLNRERERMALNELHLFLGSTFLITVHNQEIPELSTTMRTWREDPARFADSGAVAHALLDAVTDHYFPTLEHFSDRLEALEDRLFTLSPEGSISGAIHLRQELMLLRRVLAAQRDVLSSFVRRDLPFVRPEMVPYFADVHDHILRATEEVDSFRDLITGLIEVHSSNSANRLNQTMQTLTVWSIILMAMALIAGIYGMNFVFMPELKVTWGYFGALGLMFALAGALLFLFHRKGWL